MYRDQDIQVAPKQEGEVHDFLNQLEQTMESLMDAVNSIEYRLMPVLRPTSPQVAGKDSAQRCPGTQVGERLVLSINRVNHANDVLRDALNRLEV